MPTTSTPETFRLPQSGTRDPHFSLARSTYYDWELRGWIKLIRIIPPGAKRGIVLVPYDAVLRLINAAKK
jgi:hypothetical protein